ncbi:MAG: hypothetical protein QXY45_00465 [Candidatus Aenigmatarchaeota archaeon]
MVNKKLATVLLIIGGILTIFMPPLGTSLWFLSLILLMGFKRGFGFFLIISGTILSLISLGLIPAGFFTHGISTLFGFPLLIIGLVIIVIGILIVK